MQNRDMHFNQGIDLALYDAHFYIIQIINQTQI